MARHKFSVPYNNDPLLLEEIVSIQGRNGNLIDSIYLPAPQSKFGSGRAVSKITAKNVEYVLDYCRKHNIRTNLALNSKCDGNSGQSAKKTNELLYMLKNLHEKYGLSGVILANPLSIRAVKKSLPSLEVITSAFCGIDTFQKAQFFKELGADTITPNGLNRDFETLKKIKATGVKLRLMVNEGCIWNCPLREFHCNFTSHASRKLEKKDPYAELCAEYRILKPELIIKSDLILPQWLPYYSSLADGFKIVGRTMPTKWIVSRINDYLDEKYEGNVLELMESTMPSLVERKICLDAKYLNAAFFRKVSSCKKECIGCNFCKDFSRKNIRGL